MKTVFHVSTSDAANRSISKVENLLADETVEINTVAVLFDAGDAISTLERDSDVADDIRKLIDWNVEYKVCSNAIRNPAVNESNLIAGVETVSSGIGELTRLQSRGYAYIRL
ncbi:DsrE family protein [Haladaptatus caseinilyticus]|uniref:DsrE family protein n=1 Tax=Haladaptatus caseinilyticus TaxID=2993314 RepID=UPI00224B0B21|nr:DsrE family protein [Haladaptatus caseinilyticus]